jgi:glycosyltransferase involved in cell wall biosynthesis
VKLKVVEALREGLPLVTTEIGAEGLPFVGSVASVCNDAAGFAAATVLLLQDDALWAERAEKQVAYAAARFSEATLRESLLQAMTPDVPR